MKPAMRRAPALVFSLLLIRSLASAQSTPPSGPVPSEAPAGSPRTFSSCSARTLFARAWRPSRTTTSGWAYHCTPSDGRKPANYHQFRTL
jgi:hypothetical protein